MSADRARAEEEELLSDEEIRRRHIENPDVMRRARQAAELAKRGEPEGDGITAEELPDFLLEHG
jgi:hypothetical protein